MTDTGQPVSPEPPCWHKDIDAQGFCRHCGARAAIQLGNLSLAAQAGAREHAEEWLRNHGNSWLLPYADLFTAYAAPLAQQVEALRAALEDVKKRRDEASKQLNVDIQEALVRFSNYTSGVEALMALKAAQETK